MKTGPLKIFISSGEPSSDVHAAAFLKELERLSPNVRAFGIGGPKLKERPSFTTLISQEKLTAMGFVEVIGKLPGIVRILNEMQLWAEENKPDLAIVFDYPDFHFKLAARLRALNIPVICFIPPKIWAWRQGRISKIRELYDHVFTILPFESLVYEKARVPFDYVGNPLLDELPFDVSEKECRQHFQIDSDERVFLVMPGSRSSELKYLLEPFLKTTDILLAERARVVPGEKWKVLIPLPNERRASEVKIRIRELGFGHLPIRISIGDSGLALKLAHAGLIKSGTSSLEAALLDCPHVVTYHGPTLTKVFFKVVVRYSGAISLVNLIDDFKARKERFIVPELILEDFGVPRFVEKLRPLLEHESPERKKMLEGFARVREKLRPPAEAAGAGGSPMRFAAMRVLELVEKKRG